MSKEQEIIENLVKINQTLEQLIEVIVRIHNYRAPWYQNIDKQGKPISRKGSSDDI